jgi:DNA-binding transcriptional LysR family regulator
MDWDDLRLFVAIARTRRLSAAARQLGVRHTTLSRRLEALERSLDGRLFHRTAGGYLLTALGQEVLATAEGMQRAADTIEARARETTGRVSGRVRLALAPEFASHWLAPHLPALRLRHPQIDVQILVGTRQRDLSRGEAELAVQAPRPSQIGLVVTRIGRAAALLYATSSLLGSRRVRVTDAASLGDLPLLVYTPQLTLLQRARWFQALLASARTVLETNSTHALLAAAKASAGVAVLPRFVARAERGLVPVSAPVSEVDVWLVTHPEFRRDPKVRAMAEFLKEVAGGEQGIL